MNEIALPSAPLRLCARSFSARAYRSVIALRNAGYRWGMLRVYRVDVPVISIGNLSVGGTGKTPAVIHVAAMARSAGFAPAVLTRGYRGGEAADEVALLRAHLPEIPIIVDPDRVIGARRAVDDHQADLLIMDDGFQHRRLRRDLDIVLVDATQAATDTQLLPAGRLREPFGNIARADLAIMTRCDLVDAAQLTQLRELITRAAPDLEIGEATHHVTSIVDLDGEIIDQRSLKGARALLFCGLANPQAFAQTAATVGVEPVSCRWFADHAHYPPAILQSLSKAAREAGAAFMLTTEKDAVKLTDTGNVSPPLRVMRIAFTPSEETTRYLEAFFSALRKSRHIGSTSWHGQ